MPYCGFYFLAFGVQGEILSQCSKQVPVFMLALSFHWLNPTRIRVTIFHLWERKSRRTVIHDTSKKYDL